MIMIIMRILIMQMIITIMSIIMIIIIIIIIIVIIIIMLSHPRRLGPAPVPPPREAMSYAVWPELSYA